MTLAETRWPGRSPDGPSRAPPNTRRVFTSIGDLDAERRLGLVKPGLHRSRAKPIVNDRPDHVPNQTGMAYVFFVADAFSRQIVGWSVASNMRPGWSSMRLRQPAGHERPPADRRRCSR